LTTQSAATMFVTTTSTQTNTLPPPPPATVTTTQIQTNSRCEFCKIDIYATALVFPTTYVYSIVYATTIELSPISSGPNGTVFATTTILAQTTCTETPVTTWLWHDVVLHSPTTYLGYQNYTHFSLRPNPTVYGCGDLISETLNVGPKSTDYYDQVWATTAIPTRPTTAASQLLSWLDTVPTVVAQLDGVPAKSCDEPTLQSCTPTEPPETATLASTTQTATTVTNKVSAK